MAPQVVLTTIEPSRVHPEMSYDAYEYTVWGVPCCTPTLAPMVAGHKPLAADCWDASPAPSPACMGAANQPLQLAAGALVLHLSCIPGGAYPALQTAGAPPAASSLASIGGSV